MPSEKPKSTPSTTGRKSHEKAQQMDDKSMRVARPALEVHPRIDASPVRDERAGGAKR